MGEGAPVGRLFVLLADHVRRPGWRQVGKLGAGFEFEIGTLAIRGSGVESPAIRPGIDTTARVNLSICGVADLFRTPMAVMPARCPFVLCGAGTVLRNRARLHRGTMRAVVFFRGGGIRRGAEQIRV